MARYRAIHCLIWNDDKFPFLSDAAKLVFFHVLTTPMSTPFGCYKAGLNALAEESRMDFKRYSEGFDELLRKGLICYDNTVLVLFLPNLLKYNNPPNPNVVKSWSKVFSEIPNCRLKDRCITELQMVCATLAKGFPEAFVISFGKGYSNTGAVAGAVLANQG